MIVHSELKNLHIVTHPLVQHKLSRMRDETCPTGEFRRLLKEISYLLGYEVTRNLAMTTTPIRTPIARLCVATTPTTVAIITIDDERG